MPSTARGIFIDTSGFYACLAKGDCFSFCTMARLRLADALSKDEHFRQAGLNPLLA